MPELPEEMYCSEQIQIPPTYPYLLRQYAKAAIRTQPSDLLRWSAAYFRCLALNIPPPVKPRLEYPIPKDHHGLTPGWLKALLCQLCNLPTVHFKILWDRWIGACLKHETLIEILCLAGFTDHTAVPFYRFVAICTAHLTDNLTQTMIMICEILTEEPEGGSAMITLETFVDLYRFLAAIDASHPQTLKNLYFTDEILGLFEEPEEGPKAEAVEAPSEAAEESVGPEEVSEAVSEGPKVLKSDTGVVSCPDLQADDFEPGDLEKYEEVKPEESVETILDENLERIEREKEEAKAQQKLKEVVGEEDEEEEESREEKPPSEKEESVAIEEKAEEEEAASVKEAAEEVQAEEKEPQESEEPEQEQKKLDDEEETVKSDLQKLKAIQAQEMQGGEEAAPSVDEELELFKKALYQEQVPITEGLDHYQDIPSGQPSVKEEPSTMKGLTVCLEEEAEKPAEEVCVEAIPGIGGVVPEDLVEAVVSYMKEMAMEQHGMVMPRNIRHYRCPPLEELAK